jgi:hypothetical protein
MCSSIFSCVSSVLCVVLAEIRYDRCWVRVEYQSFCCFLQASDQGGEAGARGVSRVSVLHFYRLDDPAAVGELVFAGTLTWGGRSVGFCAMTMLYSQICACIALERSVCRMACHGRRYFELMMLYKIS